MVEWWKLAFALMRSRWVVGAAASALRLAGRLGGPAWQARLIGWFDVYVIRSGWPAHRRGWLNLHASEFLANVRRVSLALPPPPLKRAPRPLDGPIRVGMYGAFSGLLSFPVELFAAVPRDVQLVLFDLPFRGARAEAARPWCDAYVPLEPVGADVAAFADRVAAAVNRCDVDLFLNIAAPAATLVIDRLTVPCIANYCTGSDILHNPRVDFEMHLQPQADYFARNGTMFSGMTRREFSSQRVMPLVDYFDRRGLDLAAPRRPWREREPVMVFHGSLYKIAAPDFLDAVCALLQAEPDLQFVLMGKDAHGALAAIRQAAARHGVAERVRYDGAFSAVRGDDGQIHDPNWQRLVDWLARARLAPDPWPIPGASARFEAYAMGVPSVHLMVRVDPDSWGRPQPAVFDVPSMCVPSATAATIDEYVALCLRCLRDGAFADRVQADQLAVARQVSDESAWWAQLVANYRLWYNECSKR